MVYSCYMAPSTGFAQARAALERASQLDPQAPEVLASEGYLNMYFDWDLLKSARTGAGDRLQPELRRPPMTGWECCTRPRRDSPTLEGPSSAPGAWTLLLCRSGPIWLSTFTTAGGMKRPGRNCRTFSGWTRTFPLAHFWMGRVLSAESNCSGALSELETASSSSLRDWQPVIAAHGHIAGVCGQPSRALRRPAAV